MIRDKSPIDDHMKYMFIRRIIRRACKWTMFRKISKSAKRKWDLLKVLNRGKISIRSYQPIYLIVFEFRS